MSLCMITRITPLHTTGSLCNEWPCKSTLLLLHKQKLPYILHTFQPERLQLQLKWAAMKSLNTHALLGKLSMVQLTQQQDSNEQIYVKCSYQIQNDPWLPNFNTLCTIFLIINIILKYSAHFQISSRSE